MGIEVAGAPMRPVFPRGRRRAQGAELFDDGTDFRVWAPVCRKLELRLEDSQAVHALSREDDGHWFIRLAEARAGTRYRYRVDGQDWLPE